MRHISDFSKPSKTILLELINHDNDTNLTLDHITYENIVSQEGERNTSLDVVAIPGSGVTGFVGIEYNRLRLQDFTFGDDLELPVGTAQTHADLLPAINAALGLNLSADDIVDAPIGAWEGTVGERKTVYIQCSPNNVVYIGTLEVTLTQELVELSSILTVRYLDGFYLPDR